MDGNTPIVGQENTAAQYMKTEGLRAPKCTRCRNHGMISDLRGHKHKCYWRDCTCRKCLISSDRQRATADRIALFRQQVRQVALQDQQNRRYSKINNDDDEISLEKKLTKIDVTSLSADPPQNKMQHKKENASPPPLTKVPNLLPEITTYSPTYIPHYVTAAKTQWTTAAHEDEIHRKNIEILKYIFPFYDTGVLKIISRGCHNDMLQTVLSISSCVLESRKHNPPSFEDAAPEKRPEKTSSSTLYKDKLKEDRCCSSPYCPVNSYLYLRKSSPNFLHYTPPLTAPMTAEYKHTGITDILSPEHSTQPRPAKKFRFSFDDENRKILPFCNGCKKYGMREDKFCPLCGILYQ